MPTDSLDLSGSTALVTGATSEIGRAVAGRLARDGAEVLVHGRRSHQHRRVGPGHYGHFSRGALAADGGWTAV